MPARPGTIVPNAPRGRSGPNKTTKFMRGLMTDFVAGNRDKAQAALDLVWRRSPAEGLALWLRAAEMCTPKPHHVELTTPPKPPEPPQLGILFTNGGPGLLAVDPPSLVIDQLQENPR